ncbi:exonuclease domain-containing protein [Vibrio splendidus]|nr:3'-5' exonuclease [Vibrio splendidus]MCC4880364.1 exonuclease domain-containing protein [Vibrio splendidus]
MSNKENILVIDVEMTCEEHKTDGFESEIIQIGLVELNHRGEIVRESMRFVRPQHSEVTPFCTKLTGITPKQVKSANYLDSVLNSLVKFGIKNKRLAFWGFDNLQFSQECSRKNIDFKLSSNIMNLSLLHSLLRGTDSKVKLNDALRHWGIEPEGDAHDALVDARNTARLLQAIMNSSPVRLNG